jgi:hypothetical protein
MHEEQHLREDARLSALFAAVLASPADDGFSATVVKRIRRRVWIRRAVLGGAVIIGTLLAFQPAWQLSQAAGESISHSMSHWAQVELPVDYRIIGIGLMAVILGPLLVSLLEE